MSALNLLDTTTADLLPTEKERDYLNRSKNKIKSTANEPIDTGFGEDVEQLKEQVKVAFNGAPRGEEEAVVELNYLSSSSNSVWSKSFKEAMTRKVSLAHI